MGAVILGLIGVALVVVLGRAFVHADSRLLARMLRWLALGLCAALALFLIFTGRGAAAILPFSLAAMLWRGLPIRVPGFGGVGGGWHGAGTPGAATGSKAGSDVETAWLRMHLDHETGTMSGLVLDGRFKGTELDDLDFAQVVDFLAEVNVADSQSGALVETYLDRRFGADWRERRFGSETGAAAGGPMTMAEAREILGVAEAATAEEIREAHRALMKKLHPDQGGPAWFAVKLNAAKDLLLHPGTGP